jgi:steroid delta-isomerase-like uncharacterized protein
VPGVPWDLEGPIGRTGLDTGSSTMADTKALTSTQLRTTILAFLGAVNAHDVDRAVSFFTEDATWEGTGTTGPVVGRDAIRDQFRRWFDGFSDLHYPLEDVELYRAVGGDHAIAYWTGIMTMDGPYRGFAPTGRTAKVKGICRYEFREGKIARHTLVFDEMDVTRQLGLLPAEGSVGFRLLAGMQHLTTPIRRRVTRR